MTEIVFRSDTPEHIKNEVLEKAKKWKPRPKGKVGGIGINDADYMVACSHLSNNEQWICPIYSKWRDMIGRVAGSNTYKSRKSYIECTIHPDWISFMSFRKWALDNGWREDYVLDKDLLSCGNKMYGPDTCCFIPNYINLFIADKALGNNQHRGVTKGKRDVRYLALISNPLTHIRERYRTLTPELASKIVEHRRWCFAQYLAATLEDMRVADALRSKFSNPFV
ncbi:TPA: hypothetical protein QHB43_001702 [Aeromonas hydrophila subsp. hydrophila]|nr:hypothetical protein [Aeromonas hydrophila subsp. hydrophila]